MLHLSTRLLVLVALFLVACPSGVSDPASEDPTDIAARFVSAWNAEDFESLHDLLIEPTGRDRWHPGALRVFWDDVKRDGLIEDFEVRLGDVVQVEGDFPEGGATLVRFSITYTSAATPHPVTLSGQLPMYALDGWRVEWRRDLPWPGYRRARRFAVLNKWLPRAEILDRRGHRLAHGADDSRNYPAGAVAGATVGHLEPPPQDGTGPFDRFVGGSGLEAAYDRRLAGSPTQRLVVKSGKAIVRRFAPVQGRRGRKVRTTLDLRVQRAAESAFGATTGGAIVLDPRDGDILAAVSSSTFDPRNYVGAANVEPFNRALSGLYPPGSSLKVLTASAALDTGKVKPSTTLTGPKEFRGVRNFESGEFGTIDFAAALRYSVNTAFAQVALRLGANKLFRYSNAFGFNRSPDMQLDAATSSFPKPLDEGDLMWGSIGQAQVLATPLEMATVAATVANDGRRMEPRIDLGVKARGERAIKVRTARTMTGLMRTVVTGGTGVRADVTGLDVAGKTGTAEVDVGNERRNHAWFICFAPASDPKVAIAVVSEYGGVGGQVAAPLARSILTAVWPHLR